MGGSRRVAVGGEEGTTSIRVAQWVSNRKARHAQCICGHIKNLHYILILMYRCETKEGRGEKVRGSEGGVRGR